MKNDDFFKFSKDLFCVISVNGCFESVNPAFCKAFDYTEDELLGRNLVSFLHPDSTICPQELRVCLNAGQLSECRFRSSSGRYRWISWNATYIPNENLYCLCLRDISQYKELETNLTLEKEVLELLTRSSYDLKEVVDFYLEGLLVIYPQAKFTVAIAKKDGEFLYPLSSPSLPDAYPLLLKNGFPIGPDSGVCGAAAFFKEGFGVADLSNHPNTQAYQVSLNAMGLRSCWSVPLLDENDSVLATVAVYFDEIKEPTQTERELITRVGTFIKIIIENKRNREVTKLSNERYKLATLASKDAIYDWDILNNELYWGEGFEKIFGYRQALTSIQWWEERIHSDDLTAVSANLNACLQNTQLTYWHSEYRFLKADDNYATIVEDGFIIRDNEGVAIRMVGAMQDCSHMKQQQSEILRQNEVLREVAQINSHYIRKPLANILGLISTLKTAEYGELKELLCLLEQSGFELDDITRQIATKTYY